MSTGVAARVAAVCTVLTAVGAARAERVQVAVVNVVGDLESAKVAEDMNAELFKRADLAQLANASLLLDLEKSVEPEDASHLAAARQQLQAADDALGQFDAGAAQQAAVRGMSELAWVVPTGDFVPLYADLAFMLGRAELELHHANDANRAFALAHRIDPMKQIDPARYVPEIVSAYQAAAATAGKAKLQVTGSGQLWIDGIERGTAPATVELEIGRHVVHLTGPERVTRGQLVDVAAMAATPASVAIADAPVTRELAVRRARLALAAAADETARAAAMKQLAELLGVHAAVLIARHDGALALQTWTDKPPPGTQPGFSAIVARTPETTPTDVLAPITPPRPPDPPRLRVPFTPGPKEDEPEWYRRRWVQATVAGGVIAGVVGAILYARRTQYLNIGNGDIKYGM